MSEHTSSRDWPSNGLEHLNACPICSCTGRQGLHKDLVDHRFNTPGRWNLYACDQCGTAYLDPRPSSQTIHLAYQNYYTHGGQLDDDPQRDGEDWRSSLKQAILRAYIRVKFGGHPLAGRDRLATIMWSRPWLRRQFDVAMRHLPVPTPSSNLVLDIGCGSGRFLSWARTAGWQAAGTEFDPQAANVARSKGLEVHEAPLETLVNAGRQFDAITISHVIEHVHEPRQLLDAARRLLKPGGYFWIETPNIRGHGHDSFGAAWGGLHPPHHLQVFTRDALEGLLKEAGFTAIRALPWQPNWGATAALSRIAPADPKRSQKRSRFLNELVAYRDPGKSEFVTLTATVPSH